MLDAYASLTDRGLRVLAFAYREPDVVPGELIPEEIERDLVFVGLIGLEDPPRPEVRQAIMKCREAGIRVIMITGDGSRTAAAIAREIGLSTGDPVIIEGRELDGMNDRQLSEKLSGKEIIFSRMTPKEKMRIVSVLKDEGEVVAVTGDGVNDAPALKRADIGIAMGISGTDVAKEASDMVILDDDFSTIVHAVEEGRAIYDNIRKFITYIFASNIPEAVPYLSYMILRIPSPHRHPDTRRRPRHGHAAGPGPRRGKTVGGDHEAAAAEREGETHQAVTRRQGLSVSRTHRGSGLHVRFLPRPVRGRLAMGTDACASGQALYAGDDGMPHGDRHHTGRERFCLPLLPAVPVQHRVLFESLVFGGILFEVALQLFIVYHPFGNRVFGTAPLGLEIWLMLLPFSILLVVAEELRKAVVRRTAVDSR
ncbi:MAG: cation-translocating P-type ATPase [Desulfomicrobium escambiense]|nr:cation-translocating P-type ATPase [Desulfomicrobium escambiense]